MRNGSDGITTKSRVLREKALGMRLPVKLFQAMHSPEGVQGFGSRLGKKFGQRGHCLLVSAIDKKTLSSQTPEHVVMAKGIDQFFPGCIAQVEIRGIVIIVNQPVYPPLL